MRLLLLGAPGVGKGTQAQLLAEQFGIPHISTGDIFRDNLKRKTALGLEARNYMDKGLLVPDDVTIGIVRNRLRESDCMLGFVLDGFPRTIPQAIYLDRALDEMGIALDLVVDITGDDDGIIKRLSGRRICKNCGAGYHVVSKPPLEEGICDNCGKRLEQRSDDLEKTIRMRLDAYHRQTEPLIDYYRNKRILESVEGMVPINETTRQLLDLMRSKGIAGYDDIDKVEK